MSKEIKPFLNKLRPIKSMTALNLASESRDYLMWCPDSEFDKSVADLDMRGLVDLVHTLQDAMAVEQQTFESLSKQLEGATDPLLQQRLSAALCTSQTRLARLCSRNMRCFSQQALKSRPRSGEPSANIDSRSSSPRDSGFAVSSSGSDFEGDLRGTSMSSSSPPGISHGGASFKHSMAFFQKAANFVVATPKSSNKGGHVHREAKRSYRRTSAKHNQKNEQPVTINQIRNLSSSPNGIERSRIEDTETYENVLFINGRPQYQDDSSRRSHSYDGYLDSRKSDDEYRPSIHESDYPNSRESRLSCPGATSTTIHITSGHSSRSHSSPNSKEYESSGSRTRVQILNDSAVDLKPPSRPVRLKDSIHSKSLSDVTSCVSPPRRKPVLNFSSIADGASDKGNYGRGADCNNKSEQNRYYSSNSQIKRSHSFKEGLDFSYDGYCDKGSSNLCRTQSCCDGLAGDIREKKSSKLSRAPSVDEILESVKSLRAKRIAMVKSSPDLLLQQSQPEKNYSSSSRQKSSSKKSSKISTSSLVGVHFNGSVGTTTSSKSDKYDPDLHYYENIKGSDNSNQYENLPAKKVEVIYDRPTSNQKVEKRHKTVKEVDVPVDHYENINFEPPLYENMSEDEPTYMNVSGKVAKRKSKSADQSSNLYANIEETSTTKSKSSKKNRQNDKNYVESLHVDDNGTYDVPKAATHIYDTPPKQTRQVCLQTNYDDEGTYDTPKNNRSVLPQSSQMLLKVKKDQMKKIEDLFADCEKDSLSGGIKENSPDIPPPDYSVEGETIREVSRGKSSSPPSDYIDEGLGESDGRSYYADDQGLEVILEEPEDDCSSTHSSEEDLRRRLDLQLRLKGERRSLDGSEGIGSAEGDSHSSGSDIGAEDDCASSGIHSEDTSLGHPHIERSKEEFERISRTRKESSIDPKKEEDQIPQQDRCVEVYPETLRQRQRNMAPSPTKVDIKNWENNSGGSDDDSKGGKKFLPSVKALRSQFENGKPSNRDVSHSPPPSISPPIRESLNNLGRTSSNSSASSLVMSSLEASSGFSSLASSQATSELLSKSPDDEPVEPIFNQFHSVGDDMMCQPPSTIGWNPQPLLKKLYYIPEAPKMHSQGTNYINIDGYLEKLPSGRKKATFWNAWKRRYFVAKDGTLYYYQNNQTEKPNMKLPLMGGKVEIMDQHMVNIDDGDKNSRSASMLGIDDGKGHYVVVRCPTRQEAERWKKALDTHTVEDFSSQYVQPWPRPTNPTLLRDTLIIDIGSCSVRAGVLASQPTLPQLFFPSVVATNRETRNQIWGIDALMPHLRTNSSVAFPIRPSHKISKFSVDLNSISSLLQKTFRDLKVDPKNYNIQLSVPRVLNQMTQVELLKILFDKFGVKAVNLTHQSILALYAYNATSGIVVDIGERIDVVPVTDGYIVDGGVSRIPYGGFRILDHIRQFLFQRNLSLVNEVDSYVIRQALESVCYSAQHYNTEKQRCTLNTENFEKMVPLEEFFPNTPQYEAFRNISLDFGRFQVTEGLFNPDAWGLDHPGLQKLVHKAIQECSMDIRKEMSRSIFLSGGLSQLPGISERLTVELDNLTPPAIHPKVHSSPYRYHAAYIGACVLAESPAFFQSKITKEEWQKQGNSALRKWAL